jgi:high-affinity iron transporter
MLGQYLITLREVLEAALITSIVLAYLSRTNRGHLSQYVWYGVVSAVLASIILGISIWFAYGTLEESTQSLFEGIAALVAVAVLSSMIWWMAARGRELRSEIERQVEVITGSDATLGLIFFAFIVVFREGLETVLFLTPFLVRDPVATVTGLFLGALTSLVLAYGIFAVGMKINVRRFFYFTSLLLVLLAGGLAGYGVHEIIEYTGPTQWGWLAQYAYDLNIPRDNPLHHEGAVGSILAAMFGYTVNPEWVRLLVHFSYLAIAVPLVVWIYRRTSKVS